MLPSPDSRTRLGARAPTMGVRSRATLWALLLAVLGAAFAFAGGARAGDMPPHQMVWRQWTVADGLPQITVNDITQDRAGYLWVATQDGIARFDGVAFRAYTHAEHPGLGHGVVNALALDRDGGLWMGSMAGISRFIDGRIVAVPAEGGTGIVMGIRPHPDGGMWVAAEKGLFHARGRSARPVRFGGQTPPMVTVLQPATGPELALGHFHLVVDPGGAARVITLRERLPPVLSGALAADGGLWLGTLDGLYSTDLEGRPRGEPVAKGREIQSLRETEDGTVWIGTEHGLLRYRPGREPEPVVVPGIGRNEWVARIFVDRERNLWFGTQLTGLHRAWPDRFRRITARDGLTDGAVWSVYAAPDGRVWAGTPDGVYRGGLPGFERAVAGADLPHPTVSAMLVDRRGGLWVGTYSGLAHQPAGASRPAAVPGAGAGNIAALAEDANGDILVGAVDGMYRIAAGRPPAAQRVELPGRDGGVGITGIVRSRDGALWVGTDDGIVFQEGGQWRHAPAPEDARLRSPTLTAFGDGVLAAGSDGLFHVDRRGARRLGRAEGLHVDVAHSVLVGRSDVWYQGPRGVGRIGIAALQALLRGERSTVPVQVFGDLGSAQMAQCNGGQQDSGALTERRWLWCPSLQGLMVLDLQTVDRRGPPPQAQLQAVVTDRRRIETSLDAALALQPDERDLQIEYTGLYLRSAARLNFHGRLRGYDREWQPLGRRRAVYYTNLPPGRYTFELFAVNDDGLRGPTVALPLVIEPHWHERAAVRAAGLIALLLLLVGAVQWRLRALGRQRQRLEARVRRRTAELEAANRELGELNRRLEEASVTDPLTGLHNRRYLLEHLPHELARVARINAAGQAGEAVLTFLHLDLDSFKRINDTHGHRVGDQVLRIAADLLRANSRASDFVLRWGGEEMLVVGRDTRRADVPAWATRIVEAFRHHVFQTDAGPLRVTCSIGYALYPLDAQQRGGLGWEDVMNLADAATYLAKREGRDRCIGIEMVRAGVPADFITQVHADPDRMEADGWIRVQRIGGGDASRG